MSNDTQHAWAPAPAGSDTDRTLRSVTDHVVATLRFASATDWAMDECQRRADELGGSADTSACDVEALLQDPRVQAALRDHVSACIGSFQALAGD